MRSILPLANFTIVQKLHVFPEKTKLDVEWCTHIAVVVFQRWNKCMLSSSDLTKTFTVKQGWYKWRILAPSTSDPIVLRDWKMTLTSFTTILQKT
jgi:hypothetical protein